MRLLTKIFKKNGTESLIATRKLRILYRTIISHFVVVVNAPHFITVLQLSTPINQNVFLVTFL